MYPTLIIMARNYKNIFIRKASQDYEARYNNTSECFKNPVSGSQNKTTSSSYS